MRVAFHSSAVIGSIFLLLASAFASEAALAPKSLKVGEWVLYRMSRTGKDGKIIALNLKYSIVGAEEFEGKKCLWHEMELIKSPDDKLVYRVLLENSEEVNAETMLCFLSLIANIGSAQRYILWEPGARPTEAPIEVVRMVAEYAKKEGKRGGYAQDEPIKSLDEMKAKSKRASVKWGEKSLECVAYEATFNSSISKHRKWRYEAYSCASIPVWGLAKVVYERTSFGKIQREEIVIDGYGLSGAKSAVSGELIKADMSVKAQSKSP